MRLGYVYTPERHRRRVRQEPAPVHVDAEDGRRELRVQPDDEGARAVPRAAQRVQRAGAGQRAGARRRPRRPRARDRDVAHRCPSVQDRRRRFSARHFRRPDRGEGVRQVHAAVVAGARARAAAARRQLRFGLHVRVHVHVVAWADQPAAGRNQPAHRVRAAVRRRRQHGSAASAWPGSKTRRACSTTSPAACRGCSGVWAAATSASSRNISNRSATSSAGLQLAEEQSLTMQLPHMERPSAVPDDYAQYSKLMIDMQVVAWQTDMTRVASFMLGRDGSNRAYREIGISDGHHSISHHQGDAERVEKLIKIDELHVALFALPAEEAAGDPGRRRHAARSLSGAVRQQPQRVEHSHA